MSGKNVVMVHSLDNAQASAPVMVSVQRTGNYVASFGYNQDYRACWVGFVHSAGHYTWERGAADCRAALYSRLWAGRA